MGHIGGGGGGDWGYPELGPGTPRKRVRGSIYKKKVLQDPAPNTHTAATIRKEVLTPPPEKGYPGTGGGGTGVKIQNIIEGSFAVLK